MNAPTRIISGDELAYNVAQEAAATRRHIIERDGCIILSATIPPGWQPVGFAMRRSPLSTFVQQEGRA